MRRHKSLLKRETVCPAIIHCRSAVVMPLAGRRNRENGPDGPKKRTALNGHFHLDLCRFVSITFTVNLAGGQSTRSEFRCPEFHAAVPIGVLLCDFQPFVLFSSQHLFSLP